MDIESIVKVQITKEQVSQNIRDLNTPAYISVHTKFVAPEIYREYTDLDQLTEDGFTSTDSAYIAAQRVFSQSPRPNKLIIGKATSSGEPATVDWVKALRDLYSATNEFVVFGADITTDADKELVAEYAETKKLLYVTSDSNVATLTTATTDLASKLKAKSLQHTAVLYSKDALIKAPEMAFVGRFIADQIGSNIWGYKTLIGLIPDSLSDQEITNLKNKNVQFYTKVGKDSAVAGEMRTVGGELIDVILGIFWLEIRITEACWNLLYTNNKIGFSNQGVELFKAALYTVLQEGVTNRILSAEERPQIFVPDTRKMTSQQRGSGILSGVTFRARLEGAIIYVDGIRGTVYN